MPVKIFILTIPNIMPILHLKLTGFNNLLSFKEMLEYLLIAHYLNEETRWEEIKEELTNVLLNPKSAMDMNNAIEDYHWAVSNAEHLVWTMQEAYDLLQPYLFLNVPMAAIEGYVFTHLTCNLSGLVLYYSRQDIF